MKIKLKIYSLNFKGPQKPIGPLLMPHKGFETGERAFEFSKQW